MKKTWTFIKDHLYRHSSGVYYARLVVNGKRTWSSLKTDVLSIAKPRLAEKLKEEAERLDLSGGKVAHGSMTVLEIIKARLREIDLDPSIKKGTKHYYEEIHIALVKSWPDLPDMDARKVTEDDVKEWAGKYAKKVSPTRFNNTLSAVVQIFEYAINQGLRTRNPAKAVKRRRPNKKDLATKLPSKEMFAKWVSEIRNGSSRWADDCADLVEFLAYSGLRIGEAREVLWKHCDFKRGELLVVGDAVEKTKNSEVRRIPMIPALAAHLQNMRRKYPHVAPTGKVIRVSKAGEAMESAAERAGMEKLTHHDLRHFFATTCIESGVDIPTVSRWLGHKDGGALAMRVYGHLRNEHSLESAKKVSFHA